MAIDLKNTFTMLSSNALVFVAQTLPKGEYRDFPFTVTLPAVPALGIPENTFSDSVGYLDVSQKHYLYYHIDLVASFANGRWILPSGHRAHTPRSFDPQGIANAKDLMHQRAEKIATARVEEDAAKSIRDFDESVSATITGSMEAMLKSAGLIPADEELSITHNGIKSIQVDGDPVKLMASALRSVHVQDAVYALAAKYVLSKSDPRYSEALLKAASAKRGGQRETSAEAAVLTKQAQDDIDAVFNRLFPS